jgi:hypothetical protein
MNSGGNNRVARYAAIFALALFAFAVGGLALVLPGGASSPTTVSAADITLGVDVTTDGNSASTLGTIDSCKQVAVGASFDVDLYITDVTGLQGWEYYLSFDATKVHVTGQEALMVTGFDASDPVPNTHSPHFVGVGSSMPSSGSGVLARLTFEADAAGVSNIAIAHNPIWPSLNPGSNPIGDTTGDGYFDGQLIPGSVAIGQGCPGGAIVTAAPGPTVTLPATATPVPPTVTPAPPMRGDSTCDGQIFLDDVIATLSGATSVGNSGNCSQRGDANCSGGLDANDALRQLRFISNDPVSPPAGCQPVGDPIPF